MGEPPGRRRSFQKSCKKVNEKFTIFKKISSKFSDFFKISLKFYRIFGENLDKYLENLEICICMGSGAEPPPDASEFMEI